MFKKIERTPAENRRLIKFQIALDIIAIILLLAALIYAVGHTREIVAANYDYCYLCEKNYEGTNCYRNGERLIWTDEVNEIEDYKNTKINFSDVHIDDFEE
jgi:hypothetical protein